MSSLKNKLSENVTRQIISDIDDMGLDKIQRMQVKNLVLLFRDSFKLNDVKHATFFQEIGNDYKLFPYDSYGFCKPTSVSHVALMGEDDWQLMYIDDLWTYGSHYYVMHKKSKKILDYTYDQYLYDGVEIPYFLGRPIKMNDQAKNMAIRFLHSAGLDFTKAFPESTQRVKKLLSDKKQNINASAMALGRVACIE